MKLRSCSQYVRDFGAHLAESTALSPAAVAHLSECEDCREELAKMREVAAMFGSDGVNVPEPKRRLSLRKLNESLLAKELAAASSWWRPAVACALAAIVALSVFVRWKPPERAISAGVLNSAAEPEERESISPTMLALRHDVQGTRESILTARTAGNGMNHYRLGDVEKELR